MKEDGSVSLLLHSEDVFRKISDACRGGQTQLLAHTTDFRTPWINTTHSKAAGNMPSSEASSELPVDHEQRAERGEYFCEASALDHTDYSHLRGICLGDSSKP